jgi:DNA-directed RNA polymerase subunit RPC12/RpoP
MHHTNKKTIKSQNRNKNTTAIFIQTAWVSIFSFQKYVCYNCGKQFTMKRNLTRHMKTHVQYSQTYSCNMCGKEFSRPDNKKRHEESHNYTITSPVCGQFYNRRENMLRHRAVHERPEVRSRMLVKRPASLEPGPSNSPATRRRFTVPSAPTVRPLNLIYYHRNRKSEYYI